MATRKRKPWNADKVLFPELQTGVPKPPPKPLPEVISPSHSTPAMPTKEKAQPAKPPTEKK